MAKLRPMEANLNAFLDMIAFSEGTINYGKKNGYDVIVGGSTFCDYKDHPRKLIKLPNLGIRSTASGRYQILLKYYDYYKNFLKINDFSPESQDKIAIQMIKEQGAYKDIHNGKIHSAIKKCANIWASFPGSGYGQKENKEGALIDFYLTQGGSLS